MSYRIKLTGRTISYTDGIIRATRNRPYVELEDKAAAEQAVATGFFEFVGQATNTQPIEEEVKPEEPAMAKGHLAPEQLETMKFDELKELAVDMGIDVSKIRKKADLVAAITAEEVEYPENGDDEEVPDGIFGD